MNNSLPTKQQGLTLVELMVAILLSLILTAGVIQIFLGNKQTYSFQEAMSRNQENGRYALEVLARDLRMAGFTGCPPTDRIANTVNGHAGNWWMDFAGNMFEGYAGNDNSFPAKAFGTAPEDRVAGTDAFLMATGSDTSLTIVSHNETSATFKLNMPANMVGRIVMVCDANQVSIMQVNGPNAQPHVNVVHNTGNATPGNCSKGLGYPTVCTTNGTPYQYGPDASFSELMPKAYYIGVSSTGTGRSLWRVRTGLTAAATTGLLAPEELVDGIEDMYLLYGVDTSGNGRVNNYVGAAAVADWSRVLSVRLELLTVSGQGNVTAGVDQAVQFRNATLTPGDGLLRSVFTTTVGLRNRLD